MPENVSDVRVTDSKARLTLPKSFANSTLLIEQVSDVEIIIRKAKVIALEPGSELPPDASPAPLSGADWELFAAALDSPPPAPEALHKAMSRRAKRRRKPNAG